VHVYDTRAGRGPLAALLTALATIAGLADDHRVATPSLHPTPRRALADIRSRESATLTTVKITIDREADVYVEGISGLIVRGEVACSRTVIDPLVLGITVHQKGPRGTIVRGHHEVSVLCAASPQPWAILIAPSVGGEAFNYGKATVAITTLGTPDEVRPAMASRWVRLVPGIF
jgi:hypothetical protein